MNNECMIIPARAPVSTRLSGDLGAWARRAHLRLRLALHDARPRVRRAVDVVAAALALVVAAPLLALAAIMIRLESAGPVFYRQVRVGHYGYLFNMYKLRTMYVGADAMKPKLTADGGESIRFKMKLDPRVTRVGRFLRKYSIDELPQIWNVLVGDMTLVGPRPAVVPEVERYDARAVRRLEMKPGLTCLWQISGRSDLPFRKQLALDLEYIDRTTLIANLLVLVKTIPAVLTGRGAY